ncbi:MAG: ROK family protein [bacterium]
MQVRIGLDIGATKTKILMISKNGEIIAREKIRTDSDKRPEPIVERSSHAVEELMRSQKIKPSEVEAVAVGIAGFSNPHTGVIDISPNLHWYNVPFKKLMQDRLKRPVYMANDVNSAAWGEFCYGAGQQAQEMVAIFVGSGIGGGVVTNGKLVEGGTGTAGEVGHMIFKPHGLKCDCGKRGCYEAYGGGMPMERRMRRAVKRGASPEIKRLVGEDLEKINTRVIRQAAEAGDAQAMNVWKEAVEALGILCANLTSLLNPDRIVLGGGVVTGNPGLLKSIREKIDQKAVSLSARHVKIVKSQLGDDAVAMGAAALADLYRKK